MKLQGEYLKIWFVALQTGFQARPSRCKAASCLSGLSQHTLPQNAVGPRLIAFSSFFQPRNHVRVEAQETACFTGR
jgi:hypothetical protein